MDRVERGKPNSIGAKFWTIMKAVNSAASYETLVGSSEQQAEISKTSTTCMHVHATLAAQGPRISVTEISPPWFLM